MTKEELELKNAQLAERVAFLEQQNSALEQAIATRPELENELAQRERTAEMYRGFWNSEQAKTAELEKKITTIKNMVDYITLNP